MVWSDWGWCQQWIRGGPVLSAGVSSGCCPDCPQEQGEVEKPSGAIGAHSCHSHPLMALSHRDWRQALAADVSSSSSIGTGCERGCRFSGFEQRLQCWQWVRAGPELAAGISQSRISHWLLQQGSDLSEQKKRAFYRWYQLEKTNPGATLSMRPAPIPIEDPEWRQTPPPVSATSGTFRLRRGSRFTWRKECLAVMESYFNENQYPDEAKREEIANACNAVIQKPGKKLSDLERVTSLKVYNWFANRRKEIKRRANIEAAILESHGIDVQSPGGHSNSDDVDGNDYSEQDDSTSHSDHQDPISLAVEMAAVNHTILALARQGANEIKTEALDDD
ncbi:Homeobox-containing protein 1 [Myotis brandtii]|uniref:Homeobox-containing protein 1 n=1 Tax=Myotis brandtii TaxID=109478 RepID=S7N7J3_MYOBR|nr:Homeobox-containing protein 1 [Myotis brandtii]